MIVWVLVSPGCGASEVAPTAVTAPVPALPPAVRVERPVVADADEPEDAPPLAPRVAAVEPAERFIVPASDAPRFYLGHHPRPQEYYTPGEDEVRAFEQDLAAFLEASEDPRARAIVATLPTYRRQFMGVLLPEGRVVFGNYFCAAAGKPATAPVIVSDGGPCYFGVYYEPGSEVFWRLRIHGEG